MSWLRTIAAMLQAWTASVGAAIVALFDRFVAPSIVRLVEQEDGSFRVEAAGKEAPGVVERPDAPMLSGTIAGKRVELVLQGQRFLFRPLELPQRAADFLDGIVRAQIDRLTPWTVGEAVFGHSAPTTAPSGLTTIVAATTRKAVEPAIDAVASLRPASIALFADAHEQSVGRIKVYEQKARGRLDPQRLGRMLQVLLAACVLAALASTGAALALAERLGTRQEELGLQIAQRRAALRASSDGATRSPLALLERHKHETPASVMVLETLSRVLPDHTYLTELHLAGARLQVVGITRDAPSLIPLIEQSGHFTRATFYAPTTRSASDPGERFHIEAQIEPKATVQP